MSTIIQNIHTILYTQEHVPISGGGVYYMHMFPTFLSFTQRHPRAAAVIGLNIFIISVVLFIATNQSDSITAPQGAPLQDEIITGDTFSHDYKSRYEFQNTTYDMTGHIRKIEGDVLTIEDTTPTAPSGTASLELITVTLPTDCIFARGYDFVGRDDFKVGDYIFLKTVIENDVRTAQEVFKNEESLLPANTEVQ